MVDLQNWLAVVSMSLALLSLMLVFINLLRMR